MARVAAIYERLAGAAPEAAPVAPGVMAFTAVEGGPLAASGADADTGSTAPARPPVVLDLGGLGRAPGSR